MKPAKAARTAHATVMTTAEGYKALNTAISAMDRALSEATGLTLHSRKKVTYWTMATRSLPVQERFPLLMLWGKMACGKSQTLTIIQTFSLNPQRLNLRSSTPPTLRDTMIKAADGTLILEEADLAGVLKPEKYEEYLSDRYARLSADSSVKVPSGDKNGGWINNESKFFGATVLHRRVGFKDAALDGRTLVIRFNPNHSRSYEEYIPSAPWVVEGSEAAAKLSLTLPPYPPIPGVASRIQSTYQPVLQIARLVGDRTFIEALTTEMHDAMAALREDQQSEPDGLVLHSIIAAIFPFTVEAAQQAEELGMPCMPSWCNVPVSKLREWLWTEHRTVLDQRQIAHMARDLGFETKKSNGCTVVHPTPGTLLKACSSCEYTDSSIEFLRSQMIAEGALEPAIESVTPLESPQNLKESAKEKERDIAIYTQDGTSSTQTTQGKRKGMVN